MSKAKIEIFRNVCPRNCYNTCSLLSYIQEGKLLKVAGDPQNGYTQGKLCAKGYASTEYVYSPERLRFPLRQYPRGSGKWQRISWEEALTEIAEKILELNRLYGSNLAVAYNKCSGNIGLLHYAVEGMFNSLGAHTKPRGNPCLAAGQDAFTYDFGKALSPDPEKMADSKLIILWGVNPAWTAIQQIKFINKARQKGAKMVVIDPLFTVTAAKADLYLQIRPGTDGLLALLLARILIEGDNYDHSFVLNYAWGFEPFLNYLRSNTLPDFLAQVSQATGVQPEAILELAFLLASCKPSSLWIGFGLQRNTNGGQNIRAINALMALTGNLGLPGGGLYYLNFSQDYFPQNLLNHQGPDASHKLSRQVDLNNFASDLLNLKDPPVRLLWIANRNPLSQDQNLNKWQSLLSKLDLIVTVDLYMTKTAAMSDLLLPAASHFEEDDLNLSYWHHWLALNQKALPPFFEAKSDLQIARELTAKLNKLSPGFSNFPSQLTAEDWLAKEFTPQVLRLYGLQNWEELKDGPRKLLQTEAPWAGKTFLTPSGKFEFYSTKAKKNNLPAIAKFRWPQASSYPLRLLSPQNLLSIHSQSEWLSWFEHDNLGIVKMHPADAAKRGLLDGNQVKIFNACGSIVRKVQITPSVPPGVVVAYQGGEDPLNTLIANAFTDMGADQNGTNNIAFYDVYVECAKGR